MANLDLTTLQTQIQAKIDALSNTASAQTILQLASTVNPVVGSSASVEYLEDLPNIYLDDVPVGTMVFVAQTESIYIAGNGQWLDLEGKISRNDINSIWSWGEGDSGQLGDGIGSDKCSPVSVIGGFTDWCRVSAGDSHGVGLRTNGTLWTWGCGSAGKLGNNTTVDRCSPVSVVGGFTDWCQVSAGENQTAAVRTNGTLWTWGCGSVGRLGDGTTVNKSSPVSVIGGFTDWSQVSTGNSQTLALRSNGTIWAWGGNYCGRLGDGTTVCKSSPVSVIGGFTDWCQVSTGPRHTSAVRTNGTLWTWGANRLTIGATFATGQLGDNTTTDRCSPVSVVGGFTDWCQVSAGAYHTAAVRQNGTLWSWGLNVIPGFNTIIAVLGDGTTTNKSSPVSVVGGFTDWCQVSAGGGHVAALRTNGSLWTWGRGNCGRLGNNSNVDRCSPVSVIGNITWNEVSASKECHTLALRS